MEFSCKYFRVQICKLCYVECMVVDFNRLPHFHEVRILTFKCPKEGPLAFIAMMGSFKTHVLQTFFMLQNLTTVKNLFLWLMVLPLCYIIVHSKPLSTWPNKVSQNVLYMSFGIEDDGPK